MRLRTKLRLCRLIWPPYREGQVLSFSEAILAIQASEREVSKTFLFGQIQHGGPTARASSRCCRGPNRFQRTASSRVFSNSVACCGWCSCVHRRLHPPRYKARSHHWTWWNCSYFSACRTSMAILQSTPHQMVTSRREGCAIPRHNRGWEASWMKADEGYRRITGVRDLGIPQKIAFEEGNQA